MLFRVLGEDGLREAMDGSEYFFTAEGKARTALRTLRPALGAARDPWPGLEAANRHALRNLMNRRW